MGEDNYNNTINKTIGIQLKRRFQELINFSQTWHFSKLDL